MEAVAVGQDSVPNTTLRGLAKELGVSHATICQSLKTLGDAKLIKRLPNGEYWIIAPDISWLTKHQPQTNHENLAYPSCARDDWRFGVSTPSQREVDTPQRPTATANTPSAEPARPRKIEFVVHDDLPNMPSRKQQAELEQVLSRKAEPIDKRKLEYIAQELRMGRIPKRI